MKSLQDLEKISDHSRVFFLDFHCPDSSAFMRHRRDGNRERNRNSGRDSFLPESIGKSGVYRN